MATSKKRHSIPGSERKPLPGAKAGKAADPNERIEVTVAVRSRVNDAAVDAEIYKQAGLLPGKRRYLTREQLAESQGANPTDLARVESFAHDHHLTVVETSVGKRTVKLAGRVADMNAAFGVSLKHYKSRAVSYRGRTGPVTVPADLAGIVVAVHGLDNRPAARPRYRVLGAKKSGRHPAAGAATKKKKKGGVKPRNAPDGSFPVPDIARLYGFPDGLDGAGQCIGLIELNGPLDPRFPTQNVGAGFTKSDLDKFFSKLGLATPNVTSVGVDGGGNIPLVNPDADGEVTLDVEVAGAIAPGATIAVYFAPNTDKGFIDALNAAVHDTVRQPSVISISWGGPEDFSKKTFRDGINQALSDASQIGVTVCVAAGDFVGFSDLDEQDADGSPHADFPASSPFALGCGGTTLRGSGTTINSETVWNEGRGGGSTGGGVSNFFPLPSYQSGARVPKSPSGTSGRGVPDVSGVADPATGYQVVIGGKTKPPIGGTSAVAPLWAGLIALTNQKLAAAGKPTVGFLNPLLYSTLAGDLRDIVTGDNDIDGDLSKYAAKAGWDPCTGLGSPNGARLLSALTS